MVIENGTFQISVGKFSEVGFKCGYIQSVIHNIFRFFVVVVEKR